MPAKKQDAPSGAKAVKVRALQTGYYNDRLFEAGQEFLMLTSAMHQAPGPQGAVRIATPVGEFALPFWVEDGRVPPKDNADEAEADEAEALERIGVHGRAGRSDHDVI